MAYKIRLGGTNEFVSHIDPHSGRYGCEVFFVEGWNNPHTVIFPTITAAERAKKKVWEIEGFHTTIEEATD